MVNSTFLSPRIERKIKKRRRMGRFLKLFPMGSVFHCVLEDKTEKEEEEKELSESM